MNPARSEIGRGPQKVKQPDDTTVAQATLDDYRAAIVAVVTDTALARAATSDAEYFDAALDWIWRLLPDYEFNSDDLRSALGSSNAAGSVFRHARRLGWIESVGYDTSRFVQRHGGVIRRWRRLP